jgi:bicarbonate transport system ATP-binding protein
VLGVREDWALAYPNTHIALVKALLEACAYCAEPKHWPELSELLSDRRYLGMKKEVIWFSEISADGNATVPHHLFFGPGVNRPSRSEHLWIITQLARWAEIPFPRNYVEILERICAVGVFSTAARELGFEEVSYQRGAIDLLGASDTALGSSKKSVFSNASQDTDRGFRYKSRFTWEHQHSARAQWSRKKQTFAQN